MFKGWFTQGVVTNVISAVIIAAGGVIVTLLVRWASAWAVPSVYGVGASAAISIIVTCARLGAFKNSQAKITPKNARETVREWIDRAQAPVQNDPLDGWLFNYVVTIDGIKIGIGQQKTSRSYLNISTSLTFTGADNEALQSVPGGIDSVVRSLRIFLAATRTMYNGIQAPLQKILIYKRAFIGDGMFEHDLNQAVLEVESGFHLAAEIARLPNRPPSDAPIETQSGPS